MPEVEEAEVVPLDTTEVVDEVFADGPTMDSMIERRTPGLDTRDLVKRIMLVADALAGHALYPYQREFGSRVIEAILEREQEEITALFSRQSGKSETLAAIGGALMVVLPILAGQFPDDDRFCFLDPRSGNVSSYNEGFWIGIFAPKRSQAGIIFNRIKSFFRRETAKDILKEVSVSFDTNNGDTIRLSNGSFICCSTASDQSNIEGLTLHLGIMDESQDISDEKATKSIGPMMAATGGTIVKIGTANARKSHYYNSLRHNMRRESQGGRRNHFFVDWTTAAKYNVRYERFVRKEMLRLGERSDEFQMAYCCKFMLQRGLAISEQLFANRTVIEGPFSFPLSGKRRGMHYVAGIDFGKLHDSTVVTIIEVDWDSPRQVLEAYDPEEGLIVVELFGKHIVSWLEMQGDDYEAQFVKIEEFLRPWQPEKIALDYTGVGVAIGDRVKAYFDYAEVDLVPFSMENKDMIGREFLADIMRGLLTWPGGGDFANSQTFRSFRVQMLDLEKEYKNNGLLSLHHPDMRGAHDDYPDSLELAVHAANTRPYGGDIEVLDENIFRR